MIFLREASPTDMDFLYEWANDPIVRNNSFHSEPIPYEAHVSWFNHMMEDESVIQFILVDEKTPVGQIRLNIDGDAAEIGYSIASDYRGQGYGHKILQLVVQVVKKRYPKIKKLVAKVKPENTASKSLFESESYEMKYYCYTLDTNLGGIAD